MRKIVLVRTGELEKVSQAEIQNVSASPGDACVIKSEEGSELGEILSEPEMILEEEVPRSLRSVLRKASEKDIKQSEENKKKEKEAYSFCQNKILERGMKMKLVSASMLFDRSKLIFYFTAEERVNFRQLVKDLAGRFRTRIEMHQIGVRDEAKVLGGVGSCGRPLCCASFLKSFTPVTIRMARSQNLSLNPEQISGACGRLMCCLKYEHEQYNEARREMPREGAQVTTEKGAGKVTGIDVLKKTVTVELESGEEIQVQSDKLPKPRWSKFLGAKKT
jgi:cell fate regulator YaaT (PSP1 superfamily)